MQSHCNPTFNAPFPPDGGYHVLARLQQTRLCWDHPCGGVPSIIVTSTEVREVGALFLLLRAEASTYHMCSDL